MNERIRLLAEQANLLYPSLGPTVQTHHMKKKEQNIEKFADLLVFECIKLAVFKGDTKTARAIKEHFELK